jgi:wyosine [tRNA(Phe)-imidazoG37] synthetase (radical SAM superfamily)
MITERCRFVDEVQILEEAQELIDEEKIDIVEIRGTGEPFLAKNLQAIVRTIRTVTDKPIGVITNASMLCRPDVVSELDDFDIAIVKIDAADQCGFYQINHPHNSIVFEKVIESIKNARRSSKAEVRIQVTLIRQNKNQAEIIAGLCEETGVEMVYLSTPIRGETYELSKKDLLEQTKFFKSFKVKTIFDDQ